MTRDDPAHDPGREPDARTTSERARVGLCVDCRHARRLESAKGSVFYQCERARHDPAYRPYPPVPVHACPGFEDVGRH